MSGARAAYTPTPRTAIVDILRGWALLSVVLINFMIFFALERNVRIPADDPLSRVVKLLVQVFFEAKGWTMLAFLFGYGFSVLIARLTAHNPHPLLAYSRRMFWLLLIAVGNCALYYGDVLKDYVLVGMIVLVFHRVSARGMLALAIACFLAFPALIPWSRSLSLVSQVAAPDLALYQSSSLASVLEYGLRSALRMSLSFSKYFDWNLVMLACAFAGVYAARTRFFETLEERRRQIRWLCFGALAFAIAVAAIRALDRGFLNDHYDIEMWFLLGQMVCFMMAICWAYAAGKLARAFEALRLIGRMTLTNYVMQNLLGMLVFSGAGLGLLHKIPLSAHVGLGLIVFALQLAFSKWWLARYELGPLEWLWRRLSSRSPARPA